MKKILSFFILAILPIAAIAENANPMFGGRDNQVALYGGYALGDTEPESDNGLAMLQYSQPMTIFRLPARQNLHAGYVPSKTDPWVFAGVSFDAVLVSFGDFWLGAGIGGFIRDEPSPRLSSRFTFGERAFIGYTINDAINMEFFIMHVSNGDVTEHNLGYNFIGLGASVNF